MSRIDLIEVLRLQAWERAKGELMAVLQCYISDGEGSDDPSAKRFVNDSARIKAFIEDFENVDKMELEMDKGVRVRVENADSDHCGEYGTVFFYQDRVVFVNLDCDGRQHTFAEDELSVVALHDPFALLVGRRT